MKKIIKVLKDDVPLIISGAALVISILLATVNAVLRYTLSFTINGADALIALCFAYTVFIGSAAALRLGQHYGVDILTSRLSGTGKLVAKTLLDMLVLIVLACCLILSIRLTVKTGNKTFEGLSKLRYSVFDMAAVIGFAYSVIYEIEFLVSDIRNFSALVRKEAAE